MIRTCLLIPGFVLIGTYCQAQPIYHLSASDTNYVRYYIEQHFMTFYFLKQPYPADGIYLAEADWINCCYCPLLVVRVADKQKVFFAGNETIHDSNSGCLSYKAAERAKTDTPLVYVHNTLMFTGFDLRDGQHGQLKTYVRGSDFTQTSDSTTFTLTKLRHTEAYPKPDLSRYYTYLKADALPCSADFEIGLPGNRTYRITDIETREVNITGLPFPVYDVYAYRVNGKRYKNRSKITIDRKMKRLKNRN